MEQGAEDVPVIYLHEIKRQYKQGEATLTILNGAKLALWAGQSVALVAPSGAGKSTLLHIAGLLEHADGGEVYLDGAPTSGLTDAVRTRMRRNSIGGTPDSVAIVAMTPRRSLTSSECLPARPDQPLPCRRFTCWSQSGTSSNPI